MCAVILAVYAYQYILFYLYAALLLLIRIKIDSAGFLSLSYSVVVTSMVDNFFSWLIDLVSFRTNLQTGSFLETFQKEKKWCKHSFVEIRKKD